MGERQPASNSGSVRGKASALTSAVLILCAIANAAFLVWWAVGAQLSFTGSFVSEFSARGEPGAMFYRSADYATGALLLIAMALMWGVFPKSIWVRISELALIFLALMTITDSILPLDCVPTSDQLCREKETLGLVSIAHQMHGITGVLESTCINVALLLLGLALWRRVGWVGFSRWSLVLGLIYMVGNAAIIVQYMVELPGLGITQRIQILSFSTFLVALAVTQRRLPTAEKQPAKVAVATE